MPRGGPRPGSGRPKSIRPPLPKVKETLAQVEVEAPSVGMTPLEYMLMVMRDETADANRRDRMAVAAAPYKHSRAEEIGKKEQKQKAAEAVTGTFAMPAAPRLVVSNKK